MQEVRRKTVDDYQTTARNEDHRRYSFQSAAGDLERWLEQGAVSL